MSFTALVPQRIRSKVYMGDKVKMAFPLIKGKRSLVLHFGGDLAKRVGIVNGDEVTLSRNDSNPLIWLIKKGNPGWRVVDINKESKSGSIFKLQISWPYDVPEGSEEHMRFAPGADIYEGGIRVFLPGTTTEDRRLV